MNVAGNVCMNKLSTELTCSGLELTAQVLCILQEGKGRKVNDNFAKMVNFFTSYKEMRVCVPDHYATTKVDVQEHKENYEMIICVAETHRVHCGVLLQTEKLL